jgi:hypothetical protein
MKRALMALGALMTFGFCSQANAQLNSEIQKKVDQIKENVAKNTASLRHYTWTEQQQIFYKGDVKNTQQFICRYGADGKIIKTALGAPPPEKKKRGLRGKIAEDKKDDMKDYMQRAVALIRYYVPPVPQEVQAAAQSGKVMAGGAGQPGVLQLLFSNYVKQGDSMSFQFEQASKRLLGIDIKSYLDEPKNAVTLKVGYAVLPDGTNYAASTVVSAPEKDIQVNVTSTNFQKLAK